MLGQLLLILADLVIPWSGNLGSQALSHSRVVSTVVLLGSVLLKRLLASKGVAPDAIRCGHSQFRGANSIRRENSVAISGSTNGILHVRFLDWLEGGRWLARLV